MRCTKLLIICIVISAPAGLIALGGPFSDVSIISDELEPLEPRAAVALETIDADDALAYVSFLASDALRGRNAGTKGNETAAEWIAAFFEEMALEGGGGDGGFCQPFNFRAGGRKGTDTEICNVIAVWQGSDPVLKHEAVVIGAHFDHVGTYGQKVRASRIGRATKQDMIWNGADDNASGTAAIMEIAQAFALARVPVKRTIVFACFNAEEHGLYGSSHYVKNPYIPIEKTSAMINLDMVGRNPDKPVTVFCIDSDRDGFLKKAVERAAKRVDGPEFHPGGSGIGGSDHHFFYQNRVPSLFFFGGMHADLHRPSDEVDKITPERMRDIARVVFLVALDVANRPEQLAFADETRELTPSARGRKLLGIDVGDVKPELLDLLGLPGDQGAVRVASIYRDTAAARSKLKRNDLIISLGENLISRAEPLESLKRAIREAPTGVDVPLVVVRGDETITLEVQWPAQGDTN
jgi:hypothetical protein